jgi:hypothetical protein
MYSEVLPCHLYFLDLLTHTVSNPATQRDSKKPKVGKWYFPRGRLDRLIFAYPWKNLNEGDLPGLFSDTFAS